MKKEINGFKNKSNKRDKMKKILDLVVIFILLFILSENINYALETKLKWTKNFKGSWISPNLAELSGDVITTYGREKNRIAVFNSNGDIIWQWGPDLSRLAYNVQISDNGEVIAFNTGIPVPETDNILDRKTHIILKKSGTYEQKSFTDDYAFKLSRDGKYIFEFNLFDSPGNQMLLKDLNGQVIWQSNEVKNAEEMSSVFFSLDTRYILFKTGMGEAYIIDTINKKLGVKVDAHDNDIINSFSGNGLYFGIKNKGIFNRNGEIVVAGDFTISDDGRWVVQQLANRIKLYTFPDMIETGDFFIKRKKDDSNINGRSIKFSQNGNICMVYEETSTPGIHTFSIIETKSKTLSKLMIKNSSEVYNFNLTKTGKYFLIFLGDQTISYYELINGN